MSEYTKLKREFDKAVKELRENCSHEVLSEWVEVYWAVGRSAGYESRFCERCGKQMDPNPWDAGESDGYT